MVRQQEAPEVCKGEERGRKTESCCAMEFPGVSMKKNSFVTMELGGIIGIPNRYEPDLVL